jgi:hypothetical protein
MQTNFNVSTFVLNKVRGIVFLMQKNFIVSTFVPNKVRGSNPRKCRRFERIWPA